MSTDPLEPHVWIVQNLDRGTEAAYPTKAAALDAAARIVGNRSFAPWPDGYFAGPGDGTTSVMIRRFARGLAGLMFKEALDRAGL